MAVRGLRFPRLNLAGSRVTELRIQGRYGWNEDRATLLNDRFESLPFSPSANGYVSFTGYTTRDAAKTKHSILAFLWKDDRWTDELYLLLVYTVDPTPNEGIGPSRRRESEFLSLVRELEEPDSLSASVEFRFGDKSEADLWFPLPARLSGKASGTTLEVRGVRGAVLTADEKPSYAFVLDRTPNGNVMVSISFDLHGTFDPDMLRIAFTRAEKAVPDLVVQ